jgi:ribosomal protein S18 acetylase RimI-like enzyme
MTTEPVVDSHHRPDRTDAPAGLELRPYQGEPDLKAMVRVFNAANVEDRIEERISGEALRNWVEHPSPHFDPGGDIVLAVVDGEVVGYGWTSWVDTTDGLREYATRGHLHPAWRRRRVGTALLRHNEARLGQLAAGHDSERPRTHAAYAPERRPGAVALLLGAGYQPVRYFFDMVRPTLDDIVVPEPPAGLEVRPIAGREQVRALFDADVEAFADHWGGFDASDASFESWLTDPDFDPSLFVVAFDGDQIAGAVTNTINRHENEALGRARGLLDSVFTRRPWRGRGLAAALVARSLVLLRGRGMTSAWLGVDADNPTGALGVYKRAGFAVDLRSSEYRKPMQEMDR